MENLDNSYSDDSLSNFGDEDERVSNLGLRENLGSSTYVPDERGW